MSEKSGTERDAMVCHITCHESEGSTSRDVSESIGLEEVLEMGEDLKAREMNIVWTLLKKIKEKSQTVLTVPLVCEMKQMFPELTMERIHALFAWTVWMAKRSDDTGHPTNVSAPVDRREDAESSLASTSGCLMPSVDNVIAVSEMDSDWDPMLLPVNHSPLKLEGLSDAQSTDVEEDTVEGSSVKYDCGDDSAGLNVMFPELYRDDEDDFDIGD